MIAKPTGAPNRRTQIRDLHHSLHCSIVGTCLTTGELRRLLLHLNMKTAETRDDHAVHQMGVVLASGPAIGAKHLQKALDRKHKLTLNRFAKAKDLNEVETLWDEAVKCGDIPGAYWAALTHPVATETLVKRAFGEVHMLSHLVGAANRADICRLRALKAENVALAGTIERQQRQLRDGFTARDQTIRRLNDALARKASERTTDELSEETGALANALTERDRRLAQEAARRERLEGRLAHALTERDAAARDRDQARRECDALRLELASVEHRIAPLTPSQDEAGMSQWSLGGLTFLYVGGRTHQIPQLKSVVEQAQGAVPAPRRRSRAQPCFAPGPHQPRGCHRVSRRLRQS